MIEGLTLPSRFSDADDFYQLFEMHKAEFDAATTYAEFCAQVGKKFPKPDLLDYLAGFRWVPEVFETMKAGKQTHRALKFPKVETYAELFSAAVYIEHGKEPPRGFKFLSGLRSDVPCGHVGGRRGWSSTCPGTRSHYGAKFFCTYVLPRSEVHNCSLTLVEHSASYEAIDRTDGKLILGHDGLCIGSVWLALIPNGERIEAMMDDKTRALIEKEKADEAEAWDECENNDCNGSGPHAGKPVRLLPHSNEPLHGNDILCHACYEREIEHRRERNKTLGDFAKFSLPAWDRLKVYGE